MTKYRPISISLCNVIYKLLAKTLANHLRKILPVIISDTQSAFVNSRLITDNVLVAFETMHHISQRKIGRQGEMTGKLDMSKEYDRVEWICLDKIMEKLGFHQRWRGLMMQCISSVTYAVRINGKPKGHITPTRGLWQGDLFSPYLFLLCAEGLSTLIRKAVANGSMRGVFICKGGPLLSHLFFANDSIILCKASIEECDALQRVLSVYEAALGQQLNRAKTSLFFSSNIIKEVQKEIQSRFEAQVINQHEKYLGLPLLVGKNKKNSFKEIKVKLAGWKEKLLLKAGKEILIKAVVQAMPMYFMSCFKIPNSLCDELTSLMRNF